jgi:micrococcal nuclease
VLAAAPRSLVAIVQHVADGDSVTAISVNGTKLRIRLLGVDAPEIANGTKPGQPYGEEARDYLDHLIGGKTIRVDAYGPDQYHQLLGVLWDDQLNVNLLMVAMGYAEVYRGAPCQVYCQDLDQAEAQARRDRVGMWAQVLGTKVRGTSPDGCGSPGIDLRHQVHLGGVPMPAVQTTVWLPEELWKAVQSLASQEGTPTPSSAVPWRSMSTPKSAIVVSGLGSTRSSSMP